MEIGDVVEDRNSKYEGLGVVTELVNKPSNDVYVNSEGKTVSELNPNSDPSSEVVKIAFINNLETKIPTWWMMEKDQIREEIENIGIKEYYYPRDRLKYVREGLIEGVILRVEGVADPFSYEDGAYALRASKIDSNISYSESKRVGDYQKVTERISTLVGVLKGLEWVNSRHKDWGVQVALTDNKTINQLNGSYCIRDQTVATIANEIDTVTEHIPKVEYRIVPKGRNKNLQQTAVETYKERRVRHDYDIDKVVGEEYIVDGIFSVNLDQNSCTCEKSGDCEHIEAVQDLKN